MKVTTVAAVLLAAGLASAADAVEPFHTGVAIEGRQYDVQIHYKGFGSEAELWFLQGGAVKGKIPAEARGFPAQAPAGVAAGDVRLQKADGKVSKSVDASTIKGDSKAFVKGESADDKHKGEIEARQSFSWGGHGFNPGLKGRAVPSGRLLKLFFDSANSAAGFSATLNPAGPPLNIRQPGNAKPQ